MPLHSTPGIGEQWGAGVTQAPEPPRHMRSTTPAKRNPRLCLEPACSSCQGNLTLLLFQLKVIYCPEIKLF